MQPGPAAYEERYRFTPTVAWALIGCLAFVLIGILTPMPFVLQVLVIGFFGWGAINSITYAASRKVAFRVDHAGVTLGGGPYRYKATTRFFPWADIEKIVVWERMFPVTIARWTLYIAVWRPNARSCHCWRISCLGESHAVAADCEA